ncbi:MAG: DUF2271 domain-containing protein [Saprospiraceae bacterium]
MKRLLFLNIIMGITFSVYSQTSGTLTITTTTEDAGGNFKPKNIMAIWIGDNDNNFTKTLMAYADKRIQYLYTWKDITSAAGSQYNRVDAITGATRSSHGERICTWNGTDVDGTLVPDGTYTINMELTDKHEQGNYSTFTFEKGPNEQTLTPSDVPSFTNITIHWQPEVSKTIDNFDYNSISVFPNPTKSNIYISTKNDIVSIRLFSMNGKLLKETKTNNINLTDLNSGIYLLKITTNEGEFVKKVIKD